MAAYKKVSPGGIETNFLKIESKDLPQFKNQKLAIIFFFWVEPHKTGCDICQLKQRTTRTIIYFFLFCKSQIRCYCLKLSYQPLKES